MEEAFMTNEERAIHDLTEAMDLSDRVRDLLAAERDVGWYRGIRN